MQISVANLTRFSFSLPFVHHILGDMASQFFIKNIALFIHR